MGSKMFLGRVNRISEISATQAPNWLIDRILILSFYLLIYFVHMCVCMYVCVPACLFVHHMCALLKKPEVGAGPLRAGGTGSPDVGIMNEPWVPVKNSKSS